MIRAVTFLGLILAFPCPWYMIAVGGVLPLPVIVSYGTAGGVVLVFSLVHLVVYTWIFHRVSRLVSAIVLIAHIPRPVAGIVLVSALLALSFLPVYGSGENLASRDKLRYTAYEVYRDAFAHWPRTKGLQA